jgi:hypothetical protein
MDFETIEKALYSDCMAKHPKAEFILAHRPLHYGDISGLGMGPGTVAASQRFTAKDAKDAKEFRCI